MKKEFRVRVEFGSRKADGDNFNRTVTVRARNAKDAEDELRKKRRCDEPAVQQVGERVEMADVVALELEPGAVLSEAREDLLDVGKRVAKDEAAAGFEVGTFPVVCEL